MLIQHSSNRNKWICNFVIEENLDSSLIHKTHTSLERNPFVPLCDEGCKLRL